MISSKAAWAALPVVVGALLACKSKGAVKGSVALDGAPFEISDCQVSESTVTIGGSSLTTHSVTLLDPAKRRLTFSDSMGMSVHLSGGGASFEDLGSGCGTLSMSGSVKSGASSVTGHVEADCTGGGHSVKARFDYEGCGSYGLSFP